MVSAEKFSQKNTQSFVFADPERDAIAMREVMDVITMTSDAGQRFSGLHLNRDFSNKPLIAVSGAFLSAVTGPERKYEAYQYAAAFPEHPIQLIDEPMHGLSDGTTAAQKMEVIRLKGVSRIAQAQIEALRSRHPNAEKLMLVGTSIGGLIMLEMAIEARDHGFKPGLMVGHEIAGTDKRSSAALLKGFYWDEWRTQAQYRSNPDGQHLRDAYENDFKAKLVAAGYDRSSYHSYGIYQKDPLAVAAFILRSPFASDQAFGLLELALELNPDLTASLVSGGLSRVNRWKNIEPEVNQSLADFPDRLIWDLWPEDSHNIGLAPQLPRLVSFTLEQALAK